MYSKGLAVLRNFTASLMALPVLRELDGVAGLALQCCRRSGIRTPQGWSASEVDVEQTWMFEVDCGVIPRCS